MSKNTVILAVWLIFILVGANSNAQPESYTKGEVDENENAVVFKTPSSGRLGVSLGEYVICLKSCKELFTGSALDECIKGCRSISSVEFAFPKVIFSSE